jgi:hypothetical protein
MIPAGLDEWLRRTHEVAPEGWEDDLPLDDLRCHPDLVERLASLVRPLRARRVFVAGCPVIHHPSGPPFAAAYGTSSLLIREDDEWIEVDPYPPDVTFLRGTDELRHRLSRASEVVGRL